MTTPPIDPAAMSLQPAAAADEELTAMQAVLSALTSLKADARQRVIDYVFQRLGLASRSTMSTLQSDYTSPVALSSVAQGGPAISIRDIRSLKDQKKPRTAVEMAALVAYYLSELAPQGSRKSGIGTDDITTYFKQAGFPLPATPRQTLFNAKAAGYLDAAAHGTYKLNPVGHNLVAHGLPSSTGDTPAKVRGKRTTKRGSKKRKR